MRNLLKSLPLGVEFFFVIMFAFGGSIIASVVFAVHPPQHSIVTEPRLWGLVLNKLIAFGVIGLFLYARDWTFERLGFVFHWTDALWSVVLFAGVYAAFYAAWHALSWFSVPLPPTHLMSSGVSIQTVVAQVIVNPVFEEVFVAGYVIAALKDVRSPIFAINVSVAIRLLYHLYQGVTGVLLIVPMGLIFAYWFARKGRLWPLIAAHAIMDAVPLMLVYLKH